MVEPSAIPSAPPATVTRRPTGSARFLLLILAAVGWVAFLFFLSYSANPITLNALQIRAADRVVTAEVVSLPERRFRILKNWRGAGDTGEVRLTHVPDVKWSRSREWILPLTREGDAYRVTSGVLSWYVVTGAAADVDRGVQVRPFVYPATAEAVRQLEQDL